MGILEISFQIFKAGPDQPIFEEALPFPNFLLLLCNFLGHEISIAGNFQEGCHKFHRVLEVGLAKRSGIKNVKTTKASRKAEELSFQIADCTSKQGGQEIIADRIFNRLKGIRKATDRPQGKLPAVSE